MAETTVYVKFAVGDTSELTSKAAELTQQEQKALTAGNAELDKKSSKQKEILETQQKTVDAQKAETAAAKETTAATKETAAAAKDQQKVTESKAQQTSNNLISLGKELQVQKKIGDAFQKQFVSAKTVGDQIIALGNVFDAAFQTGGAESVEAVYQEIQKEIQGTGLTVEQFVEQLKSVDPATQLVTESNVKLSSELRNVKDQMAQLAASGQANTAEYKKLQEQAISLTGAQMRVNAAIKDGVKTNETLLHSTEIVEGLTAGFEVATGVMSLFGKENEDVMKTIQFLNGVMVISNGIQQTTTILKNADNIVTKGLTAAYKFLTVSIYGATTGLTAFDTALAATGVGVFIIAIGIALEKLYTFISSLYDASDAVEHMDLVLQKLNGTYDERAKKIQDDGKLALEAAKRSDDAAGNSYKVQKKINDDLIKNQQVRAAAFKIAADQIMDKNSEIGKKFKLDDESRAKERDKFLKESKDAEKNVLDLQFSQRLEDSKRQTDLYKQNADAAKKASAAELASLKADQQAKFDIVDRTTDYQIEGFNKVANSDKEVFQTRLNALENSNKLRMQQIEVQRKREKDELVASGKATTEQLLNIDDKYNTERDKQTNDYYERRKNLIQKNESEIAQAEIISQQNVVKARINVAQKGSAEELQATNDLIRLQAEAQIKAIDATVENEELKAAKIEAINLEMNKRIADNNEAYTKKRLADASDAEKQAHDLAIALANISLVGKNPDSKDVFNAQQDARKKYLQENLDDMARLQNAWDTGQITDKKEFDKQYNALELKATNQRIEILKAEAEKRKKINDAIKEAAFDVAQSLSDAVFSANADKRDAQLQEQEDQLDKARQNELDNENLTEQQKEQINERYDAKERQLKRRAAEQDKQASIAQAEINAALAITKTLASVPFPFNIIAAAAVAAQTIIQVAKIKSTPLPAYEKGTRNAKKGSGMVGEKGAEIVTFEGGETVLTHKETMKVLQYASTKEMVTATINNVLDRNASISERIANYRNNTVERVINRGYVNDNNAPNVSIDYDKLASKFGEQLKRHGGQKVETNIDADGFNQYIEKQGTRIKYLNSRYKL